MTAQRLANIVAPGALVKSPAALRRRPARDDHRDAPYLQMVRQLPCLKCGLDPCGVAAHFRSGGKRGGTGFKSSDMQTTPLCDGCHTRDPDAQHRVGEIAFWHLLGINPLAVAARLYAKRGDIPAMRAIVFETIAERECVSQYGGTKQTNKSP